MNDTEVSGNGVVFNIFHYLWFHDFMTGQQPSVQIPHTIEYQLGAPKFWYFSSKTGKILRKQQIKTVPQQIYDVFTRNIPPCGVVALFIHKKEQTIYEYMNEEEFKTFVFKRDFQRQGILQQFIQPKRHHNTVIKSMWTQQICFFETFQNKFPINEQRADIFQRVITFESSKSCCIQEPMKGCMLSQTIESKCNAIATHVQNVTQERIRIKSMTVYWKQSRTTLYLILCTDVQTFQENQSIQRMNFRLPSFIDEDKLSYPLPIDLKKNVHCFKCKHLFSEKCMLQLPKRQTSVQTKTVLGRDQIIIYDQGRNSEYFTVPIFYDGTETICNDCYVQTLKPINPHHFSNRKVDIKKPQKMVEKNYLSSIQSLEETSPNSRKSLNTSARSNNAINAYSKEKAEETNRLNRIIQRIDRSVSSGRSKYPKQIIDDIYGLRKF